MTPAEVRRLITLAVGLDQRLILDAESSEVRAQAWTELLREAETMQVVAALRRYYLFPQPRPIQVGDLAQAGKPRQQQGWWRRDLPAVTAPMPESVRRYGRAGAVHPARHVDCPWCRARPGDPCEVSGRPMNDRGAVHPARRDAWVAEGGAPVGLTVTATEREPDDSPDDWHEPEEER